MAWADFLQRVFEVDALRCPDCGGRMRVLPAITDPALAAQVVDCVGMPSGPPLNRSAYRARIGELAIVRGVQPACSPGLQMRRDVVGGVPNFAQSLRLGRTLRDSRVNLRS